MVHLLKRILEIINEMFHLDFDILIGVFPDHELGICVIYVSSHVQLLILLYQMHKRLVVHYCLSFDISISIDELSEGLHLSVHFLEEEAVLYQVIMESLLVYHIILLLIYISDLLQPFN